MGGGEREGEGGLTMVAVAGGGVEDDLQGRNGGVEEEMDAGSRMWRTEMLRRTGEGLVRNG